jgi:hypothetical protein
MRILPDPIGPLHPAFAISRRLNATTGTIVLLSVSHTLAHAVLRHFPRDGYRVHVTDPGARLYDELPLDGPRDEDIIAPPTSNGALVDEVIGLRGIMLAIIGATVAGSTARALAEGALR